MTSKPDLHLVMPESHNKPPQSAMRSPRFHEDFDAPFSEAILNASTITLATESDRSPSSQDSSDVPISKQTSAPRPVKSREDSWSSMNSNRSSSSAGSGVNERIREWARKSFVLGRRRSDDGGSSRPS